MLNAFWYLLFPKLCQHNPPNPNGRPLVVSYPDPRGKGSKVNRERRAISGLEGGIVPYHRSKQHWTAADQCARSLHYPRGELRALLYVCVCVCVCVCVHNGKTRPRFLYFSYCVCTCVRGSGIGAHNRWISPVETFVNRIKYFNWRK